MKFALLAVATALVATVSAAPLAEADANADGPVVRIVERRCNNIDTFYDDAPTKAPITFDGAWSHLTNQGNAFKFGSFSYTKEPNAQVIIPHKLPKSTVATVSVWSSKKSDRGQFNVYLGKTLLGTGDQYTSGAETASQAVFTRKNVALSAGDYFVIKNDKGAKYVGFDAIEIVACI